MGYNSGAEGRFVFEGISAVKPSTLSTEILESVAKNALIDEG